MIKKIVLAFLLINVMILADYNQDLFKAIEEGNITKASSAIKNGAKLNKKNTLGFTPLVYGIIMSRDELVTLFIEKGANVNEESNGMTPLYHALLHYNFSMAELLISKGALVNEKESSSYSQADTIVNQGNISALELLVEHGLNLKKKNALGENLIFSAVRLKNLQMTEKLISLGVSFDEKNYSGETPLYQASSNKESYGIVKYLINKGADNKY